jgi:DNA polymerase
MNTEEKNSIKSFLDLCADYLRDGHRRDRAAEPETLSGDFSSLPLAYQIDEEQEELPENRVEGAAGKNRPFADGDSLEKIAKEICACEGCALAVTRTFAVPGEGSSNPLVMVIGEGPGADEDKAGRPFVGRAGQLLDKMLSSIGLSRNENCFIANMVKCRPPGNRDPAPEEISSCFQYLERQIALLRPGIILCAGRVAAQSLLKTSRGINALRGEFAEFFLNSTRETKASPQEEFGLHSEDEVKTVEAVIPVLPTFHPSALLRDESFKRPAWEDLKLLASRLSEKSL